MSAQRLDDTDNCHQESLDTLGEPARDALELAFTAVEHVTYPLAMTNIPDTGLFANAVGALACFSRAHQHLRACLLATTFGYYESVGPTLRAAYEAAECGQYLSRNPAAAEKWLKKGTSWPHKEVRHRLGDVSRGPEYGQYYGVVCGHTHPTASAAMSLVEVSEGAVQGRLARAVCRFCPTPASQE